ncbi:MAG: F0F1 ATP synthase subunit gamma [Geobacteraceae bacterium]|nr:F0F1 ATP synthase subunit gamma [Geobacteraceae bacterium]
MISSVAIERKMKALSATGDIVDAMKAYAGVAIRKTEELITNVREFEGNILSALAGIMSCNGMLANGRPQGERRLLVAFGSAQGFCGPFNEKMADVVTGMKGEGDSLFIVGRRLRSSLSLRGGEETGFLDSVVSVGGIASALRECLSQLLRLYRDGEYYTLTLVYTSFSGKSAEIAVEQVLPPDVVRVPAVQAGKPEVLLYLDQKLIFERLLEQFLGISLYRCFLESLRSENRYRLISMDGASDTIRRSIAGLDSLGKYARQEEVTEEMLEILGSGGFFGY